MSPCGIFYIDSKQKNAFAAAGIDTELHTLVAKACADRGITSSLTEIRIKMKDKAPVIKIYG